MKYKRVLPEQIAMQLRRDILRGRLRAGSSLKERDCAAEMGVSRTPMREAIRILAREGLVILRPSRSPLVANPDLKEISDQVVVLVSLEQLSARLACLHATEADIARLTKISDHMAEHFDTTDPLDMFEIDMSFHTAIATASQNASLAETHGIYLARLWRARYLSAIRRRSRDRVLRQHTGIVQGLMNRDADQAKGQIHAHLEHLLINIRHRFEHDEAEEIAADSA